MCGVVGLISQAPVNQELFDAIVMIQHRGQDAAGMMTEDQGSVCIRKGNGLLRDVIRTSQMRDLQGAMGIGHVRYPTAGTPHVEEALPMYVNSPLGLGLVYNGNLINTDELKETIIQEDMRHLNTHSDSEVLLNVFAHELRLQIEAGKPVTDEQIFAAVEGLHQRVQGGYAVIIQIVGHGLLAIRDPHGIRPLIWGERQIATGGAKDYMIASEDVALKALDFKPVADVQPGEAVWMRENGKVAQKVCAQDTQLSPCIFEYIYLARQDSMIDGVSVYQARLNMSNKLAEKIQRDYPDCEIDVVVPIPDTSRSAALPMASVLGVPYREGFVKNRYIGRTFIMPEQTTRTKSVKQKLNPIEQEFKGKSVLLVDDSIVRGTTSREVVKMVRAAGAKKVYFSSLAPEIRFPNIYGIDMPAVKDFIAHDRNTDEIAQAMGVDAVIYQELSDLIDAVRSLNPEIQRFEDSVFTGDYVTGTIPEAYLKKMAQRGG